MTATSITIFSSFKNIRQISVHKIMTSIVISILFNTVRNDKIDLRTHCSQHTIINLFSNVLRLSRLAAMILWYLVGKGSNSSGQL